MHGISGIDQMPGRKLDQQKYKRRYTNIFSQMTCLASIAGFDTEVYFRASSDMSQVLVETLNKVQWHTDNTSSLSNTSTSQRAQHYIHTADETVRAVGFALVVVFLLICVVLLEWIAWVRRRMELELADAQKLEMPLYPVV